MKNWTIDYNNISIDYMMKNFSIHAVRNASIKMEQGKITAVVGESGCGKTTLGNVLIRCITKPGEITSGKILFKDRNEEITDITLLNEKQLNDFRWNKISMVFQGAQSSLNPTVTIFNQFYETLAAHGVMISKKEARIRFTESFANVNLGSHILDFYPHEISGGMKQRVIISLSTLLDPQFIILDEPTTALDVIMQNYIFHILKSINDEKGTGMMLLTHDIAIVASYADTICVMYGGRIVESGPVRAVFKKRYHPYTRGLIEATPSLKESGHKAISIPGNPPDIQYLPPGCPFYERCTEHMAVCEKVFPKLVEIGETHFINCHKYCNGETDA
jgi:peptide/nickel transport system ATP-binding protein